MTIIHPKSVLLLGAGVSEPFGMPLGGQLVDLIANEIARETPNALSDDYGRKAFSTHRVVDFTTAGYWHQSPIYGTVMRQYMQGNSLPNQEAYAAYQQIQALHSLLKNQTAETIDAFIAENPESAALTKLMLSAIMLKSAYTSGRPGYGEPIAARRFDARTLSCEHRRGTQDRSERNWIHLLINIIRHGIDGGSVSPASKIKIITFNYDMILEHVLEKQFANRERPLEPYTKYVEILHVHGQLGAIEPSCTDPARTAIEWAKGVNVVKDDSPTPETIAARERAAELIAAAHNVYAVGFAFAGPNCRLLGLDRRSPNHDRRLVYCNYDGNRGIKEAAKSYADHVEEVAGEWSRPLSVCDFIRAGYLGEPPS